MKEISNCRFGDVYLLYCEECGAVRAVHKDKVDMPENDSQISYWIEFLEKMEQDQLDAFRNVMKERKSENPES